MNDFEKLIFLMFAAVLMVGVAHKTKLPYPIVLVLGGGVLSFIPSLDFSYFDPNLILTVVLPPILYYAAFWTSFREFRQNFTEICSLALGLVILTTAVIGLLFKWFFPHLSWALAFAFGAIVSPPDAVAITSILKRFSISSRLQSVLEGESLVNDASALVLYKIAVSAILSGTFSFLDAGVEFIQITVGGILFGLLFGYLIQNLAKRYLDPVVGVIFSFLIPYLTYILAVQIGVSGVLAVVVTGLIGSRIIVKHHSSLRRVLGFASWDLYIIMLNCFIFILIGSQLDELTRDMGIKEILLSLLYAFIITLVMLIVRFAWVCMRSGIAFLRTRNHPELSKQYGRILREGTLLGWSGMRGIVSLTAAFALPLAINDGSPLEGREFVIFMVFLVIMYTMLLPGFTLERLLSWLRIGPSSNAESALNARKTLEKIALEEISRLHSSNSVDDEEYGVLSNYFKSRFRIIALNSSQEAKPSKLESARQKVLQAQRKALLYYWEQGHIDDKMLVILERELDVEETQAAKAEI